MSARSSFTLRVVKWLAATAIAGATAAALLLGGLYLYLSPRLPEIDQLRDVQLQEPLRVYSRGGELLAVYGTKRRRPLPLDEIPERIKKDLDIRPVEWIDDVLELALESPPDADAMPAGTGGKSESADAVTRAH